MKPRADEGGSTVHTIEKVNEKKHAPGDRLCDDPVRPTMSWKISAFSIEMLPGLWARGAVD
jgi:hypothetical protein